jgi:hypothetical protein
VNRPTRKLIVSEADLTAAQRAEVNRLLISGEAGWSSEAIRLLNLAV